jgi:hypothetical protein
VGRSLGCERVAAGAVLPGDHAKCGEHESVMLTLSDQWGRNRKTMNAKTPMDGLGWAHELE